MKVYLAARYSRREEILTYARELEAYGFQVTSRWLNGHHGESFEDITPQFRRKCAEEDRDDLLAADACIVFLPGGRHGGLFWEMGAADAIGNRVILVGPRETGPVFGYQEHIVHFDDWAACLFGLLKACVKQS